MVAPNPPPVKPNRRERWQNCIAWIDRHPRLGWYLFLINFLNVVLNLLNLFK